MKALAVNVKRGEQTLLSVRPERVEISPAKGSADVVLDGEIRELIYLGDHIRTRLAVAGHDDFVVKVPNNTGHANIAPGKRVKVGWKAADCRALDFTGLPH